MAEFNRNLVHNVGTTYTSISDATPMTDYEGNYDVVIGLRIMNLLGTTITVRIRYYDNSETSNTFIEYDTPILTGEILNINRKIVIESSDKLEIICSDVDGCDVICSYMREGGIYSPKWYGDSGIIAGGCTATNVYTSDIDTLEISSGTVGAGFSSLSIARSDAGHFSNGTIGVLAAGTTTGGSSTKTTESVVISTGAINSSYTDEYTWFRSKISGCANLTIGLLLGGYDSVLGYLDHVDKIIVDTGVKSSIFANLSSTKRGVETGSDGTYGFALGGYASTYKDAVEQIDFSTGSINASFSTLGTARARSGSFSDNVSVIVGGGYTTGTRLDGIESMEMANGTMNSSFGTLSAIRDNIAGLNNSSIGLFAGGFDTARTNVVESIEISSGTMNSSYTTLSVTNTSHAGFSGS